ncbi:glycine zipper 2TM domain-containing protein [Pelagerythrobacter marinus]|uniref:glycine zipper 2TM domain-containing protein n=1 Tax=Pelagerythrobacter marinus TaxID=538382 RepID=UPI002036D8E4|nr:glycine zipper 2TM domain-containing protein [Pelagerythrobacter marinus]USA40920.1 glycine zipper 2TM domain-containing protein [Pelagerythrobacter marinus]WPZ07906.1 glycine zipper 2TM domain-containing protein [Pelagerythrobacter marinus]
MLKKTLFAAAAIGLSAGAAPAMAAELPAPTQAGTAAFLDVSTAYDRDRWRDHDRYDRRGRYREPRRITRNSRMWRGRDGRYYCKRDNGTTGLVIGAGVGALAGHEIAGNGGDRTLGAILGGAIGAVVGREIDRGTLKCR